MYNAKWSVIPFKLRMIPRPTLFTVGIVGEVECEES